MTSVEVRSELVDALKLDFVGPENGTRLETEILPQMPSRWYLTGFLSPIDAAEEDRSDPTEEEGFDMPSDRQGTDDATIPESVAARKAYFPSSIGMSLLVSSDTKELSVTVRWGDYQLLKGDSGHWQRTPREQPVTIQLPHDAKEIPEVEVPSSQGLKLAISVRPIVIEKVEGGLPKGTRSLSVFLVNRRKLKPDSVRDEAYAFQAEIEVKIKEGIVSRPDLRSLQSTDWDDRLADLQYRDDGDYAVGHNVAAQAILTDGQCYQVRTCWMPLAEVERVAPADIKGVELSMDALATVPDSKTAKACLEPLATQYEAWIADQKKQVAGLSKHRKEIADELFQRIGTALKRIRDGIELLNDQACLEAFRLSNKAMAKAARQRQGVMLKKDPGTVNPRWRPFQLAFLLMNLKGLAEPGHTDRGVVDLLFFPTGGGKTEAYLGLAAFALVHRRLKNPGTSSAGLAVLMRYTLRLLTLDQLGRAATLICALELERQQDVQKLGDWPFEIGLWVGKGATPNVMGKKGDNNPDSARAKTIAYKNNERKGSPIPLEECPWCGTKFTVNSFQLVPNPDHPIDLRVVCSGNRECAFSRDNALPLLTVDEPIYRRLPCFMIATVDKFAGIPWVGQIGAFFGKVDRHDQHGFYGPCDPGVGLPLPQGQLNPPDLIIQDELHLISGPLGTMVGLYECALDELSSRMINGKKVRPKIIASTATVRRAEKQIRALYNHKMVDIFPPPGPDRRDSFFAETLPSSKSNARQYLGIAAQGRSPKVVMLRTYLALLAAGEKAYERYGKKDDTNPADPYMTLLGYFNSLRELGGARRVIEDEVSSSLQGYGKRKRVNEEEGSFSNRRIAYEVVELTSRESTNRVAEAKARLNESFASNNHVDVAIATNMISVGLDIVRLGLMVVTGQPKTSAEYIQATSRVGRDFQRPGLVVTMLNVHKPRDRSHYERFYYYHQTFYRSVEPTSVTPFSPRALDRGLAAALVGLARHGNAQLTHPKGASQILVQLSKLDPIIAYLVNRVSHQDPKETERLQQVVRDRAKKLLDDWNAIAHDYQQVGAQLQYNPYETGGAKQLLYDFLDQELKKLPLRHKKFRANRSLRDVEPSVNLWLKTLDGYAIENEEGSHE
ncbi:MAG: helicase [Planctomycetia bacterium]|nr:helicase [Planctomycetia bacterium]